MRGPFLRHHHGSAARGRLGNAGGPSTGHGPGKNGGAPDLLQRGGQTERARSRRGSRNPGPGPGPRPRPRAQLLPAQPPGSLTAPLPERPRGAGGAARRQTSQRAAAPPPRTPSPGRKRKGLPGPPGDRDAEALPGGAAFPALAGPRKPRRPHRALQPGPGPAMRETLRPAGEQLPGRGAWEAAPLPGLAPLARSGAGGRPRPALRRRPRSLSPPKASAALPRRAALPGGPPSRGRRSGGGCWALPGPAPSLS